MILNANRRQRVEENIITHVVRAIAGKGKISVKDGQEVTPEQILASFEMNPGFWSIDLAKKLKVKNPDGEKYLQRAIGSRIYKGELLAFKKELLGERIVTSPTDGVVDRYDKEKGEVVLKFFSKSIPLTAGVFGIVAKVDSGRGEVIIKTMATEVYGVLGAGRERGGELVVFDHGDNIVSKEQINKNLERKIIVGGAIIYGEALKKAAQLGVSGIVSGGFNARDFISMAGGLDPNHRLGNDPGMSILATEGYGALPTGEDILSVVKGHSGKFAFLFGNERRLLLPSTEADSIIRLRKVELPLHRWPHSASISIGEIRIGSRVRVIWPPFAGWQAKVVALDQIPTTLSSGISTYLVTVETAHRKLKVPCPNVELI